MELGIRVWAPVLKACTMAKEGGGGHTSVIDQRGDFNLLEPADTKIRLCKFEYKSADIVKHWSERSACDQRSKLR